jgi:hypothetical protein
VPVTPPQDPEILRQARELAIREAWRRGDLRYKLHDTQLAIHAKLTDGARIHFISCSRRLGKSYLLVTLAFENALRLPNARVLYLAPWARDAAEIAGDLASQILSDCPADFKPEYSAQNKEFRFPNGSVIRLKGTNGEHSQFLRGGAAHLVVLDECGIMDDLMHVVRDVVTPMTLTTRGKIVLATTPARTPGHESKELYEDLARKGALSEFTIRDAPHIAFEDKVSILCSAGESEDDAADIVRGTKEPRSNTAQREYFCRWVTDASAAVIPEFDAAAEKEIVREWAKPAYRDCYVSMDPGFVDKTGILFGYWDFRNQKLVIEDELVLSQANTPTIAQAIEAKELALWGGTKPHLRVSDVDKRLVADLAQLYQIGFAAADKRDSASAIAEMRRFVQQRILVIDPRCTNLIRQMHNAVWNKRATDFEREAARTSEGDTIAGHFDLVAALKYLVRMVNRHRNPFPEYYFDAPHGTHPGRPSRGPSPMFKDTPLARRLRRGAR